MVYFKILFTGSVTLWVISELIQLIILNIHNNYFCSVNVFETNDNHRFKRKILVEDYKKNLKRK